MFIAYGLTEDGEVRTEEYFMSLDEARNTIKRPDAYTNYEICEFESGNIIESGLTS